MNALINHIAKDKIIRLSTLGAIGLLVFHLGYIAIFFQNIPPVLPLYNQLPWGEARLGDRVHAFIPFSLSLSMLIVNLIFSAILYEKMPLVSRIISIMNLLLALLSAIFIFRILQLVV